MKSLLVRLLFVVVLAAGVSPMALATVVTVVTPQGTFDIDLFEDVAPNTVANFLNYVNSGRYDGTFVHRSIPGFVIQGGGFTFNGTQAEAIATDDPIDNEFQRSNTRGTVAMAKQSGDPDSATSQWFINLADNSGELDTQNGGFTVFGEVIGDGMQVVDTIANLPRFNFGSPFDNLPLQNYDPDNNVATENLITTDISVQGAAPPMFEVNEGVTGSWFNVATAGQGWLIDVYPTESGLAIFLAWFTYDTGEPDSSELTDFGTMQHRWFTAAGTVDGDTATLTVFQNTGGVFNDTRQPSQEAVGTMTIVFTSCTTAILSFSFDAGSGGMDDVEILRLTPDVFCGAMAQ